MAFPRRVLPTTGGGGKTQYEAMIILNPGEYWVKNASRAYTATVDGFLFGYCKCPGNLTAQCYISINGSTELTVAKPGEYYQNSNVSWLLPISKGDVITFRLVNSLTISACQLTVIPVNW